MTVDMTGSGRYLTVSHCPFCDGPLPPRRRAHCGATECARLHANAKQREWQRQYRERTGTSYNVVHYDVQRTARRKANPHRQGPARASSVAADDRRRARKAGVDAETFAHVEVFERDGWTCQLCGEPVDRALPYPHPRSVTLDHVHPLARGGPHTRANTQCAHLFCNVKKGARINA